jgi:hypothetical protein
LHLKALAYLSVPLLLRLTVPLPDAVECPAAHIVGQKSVTYEATLKEGKAKGLVEGKARGLVEAFGHARSLLDGPAWRSIDRNVPGGTSWEP